MNCKRCGTPIMPGDQFCKGCGAAVNDMQNNTINNPIPNPFNTNGQAVNQQQPINSNVGEPAASQNTVVSPTPIVDSTPVSEVKPIANPTPVPEIKPTENPTPVPEVKPIANPISVPEIKPIENPTPVPEVKPVENPTSGNVSNFDNSRNENTKKNNLIIPIVIGFLVIVIIGLIVYIVVGNQGAGKENNDTNDTTNTADNNNVDVATGYKVNYGDFTVTVPENYQYEIAADGLYVTDESESWIAQIDFVDGSFTEAVKNLNQIKMNLEAAGMTINDITEETFKGKSFIAIKAAVGGRNVVVGYAMASATKVFAVLGYNVDDTHDFAIIENVVPILSSAIYNAGGHNIGNDSVDMNSIINAIK